MPFGTIAKRAHFDVVDFYKSGTLPPHIQQAYLEDCDTAEKAGGCFFAGHAQAGIERRAREAAILSTLTPTKE